MISDATTSHPVQNPRAINWGKELFTPANRLLVAQRPNYSFSRVITEITKSILGTREGELSPIAAQVLALLEPHVHGEHASLNKRALLVYLRQYAFRLIEDFHGDDLWFIRRGIGGVPHSCDHESRIAREACESLIELFGLNTVRSCTAELHQGSQAHAPLIAAAPIEVIERWIAVPETRPSLDSLRALAADRLANNLALTVAAGIYLPFVEALQSLSGETRAQVAHLLRKHVEKFARYSSSDLTGCSHAMHLTICEANTLDIAFLPITGPREEKIPQVIAFQILFLAFYNASMMIPGDCGLPRGSMAIAEDDFPKLRAALGSMIVPEILA